MVILPKDFQQSDFGGNTAILFCGGGGLKRSIDLQS
jgi:hypothetical protein